MAKRTTTKKSSLIEELKKEYNELYAEKQREILKTQVFELMEEISDVENSIKANNIELAMLKEQKDNLLEQLDRLGERKWVKE